MSFLLFFFFNLTESGLSCGTQDLCWVKRNLLWWLKGLVSLRHLSSPTRDQTHFPALQGRLFTTGPWGKSPPVCYFDIKMFHVSGNDSDKQWSLLFLLSRKTKLYLAPPSALWDVTPGLWVQKPGKYFVTGAGGAVSLPPDAADLMRVVPNLGCTISIALTPGSGPQRF